MLNLKEFKTRNTGKLRPKFDKNMGFDKFKKILMPIKVR